LCASVTAAAGDDGNQFRAVFTNTSNPVLTATTTAATLSVISGQSQTITFGALASVTYGDADFAISATATSGLPVSFTASGYAASHPPGACQSAPTTRIRSASAQARFEEMPSVVIWPRLLRASVSSTALVCVSGDDRSRKRFDASSRREKLAPPD
jgi:hypothetical protein